MTSTRPAAPIRPLAARSGLAAAVLALLSTAAGCSIVRGLQTPNRGATAAAGADTVRFDTATVDTAAIGRTASDSLSAAAPDSASRTETAPDSVPRGAPPPDRGRATDSAQATDTTAAGRAATDSLPLEDYPTAEALEERGPTYTPYAIGPQLLPGEWLSNLLSDTLAPVVDRHDALSVRAHVLFWVLVDRDGAVRDAVVHTSSESEAFDQAARVVANRLRYRPAVYRGESVPVWVLERVSLLMR